MHSLIFGLITYRSHSQKNSYQNSITIFLTFNYHKGLDNKLE